MFDANEAEIRPCKSFEWDTKTVAHGTSCSIRANHVVRCHKRFAFGTHEERCDFFVRLLYTGKFMGEEDFDVWIFGDMFKDDCGETVLSKEHHFPFPLRAKHPLQLSEKLMLKIPPLQTRGSRQPPFPKILQNPNLRTFFQHKRKVSTINATTS